MKTVTPPGGVMSLACFETVFLRDDDRIAKVQSLVCRIVRSESRPFRTDRLGTVDKSPTNDILLCRNLGDFLKRVENAVQPFDLDRHRIGLRYGHQCVVLLISIGTPRAFSDWKK
jgi:hypothetical protein